MENILLALDAMNPDKPAIDFGCYIANSTHSKLTGVFLEDMAHQPLPYLVETVEETGTKKKVHLTPAEQEKEKVILGNIEVFRKNCQQHNLRFELQRPVGLPSEIMINTSRYADLIITDSATSFQRVFEGTPTHFVRDLLEAAECPVVIAPDRFDGIDEIVFAYDGSPSAVFAMKQFTYLFPQWEDKKLVVLHINEKEEWKEEDKKQLSAWLRNHYSAIGFETTGGDASYELLGRLFLRKKVFIVMGAYGRSALSRFFRHSHADILLRTISQPVFIAHY